MRCVAAAGLDAAVDRKPSVRSYRRRLDGEQEARLVALTCGAPPEGHQRWRLRLLADRLELPSTPKHGGWLQHGRARTGRGGWAAPGPPPGRPADPAAGGRSLAGGAPPGR